MTSLTISANNSAFLEQLLEIAKIIAKKQNEKFKFHTEQSQTLKVINEARNNKNLSKAYSDVDELMSDLLKWNLALNTTRFLKKI